MEDHLTVNELLAELESRGFGISYVTLNRYVKAGFVEKPKTINAGRPSGRVSVYKRRALFEAIATHMMLNPSKNNQLRRIKELADRLEAANDCKNNIQGGVK